MLISRGVLVLSQPSDDSDLVSLYLVSIALPLSPELPSHPILPKPGVQL